MKHLIILFHGMSLFTGISAVTICGVAYYKYRSRDIKNYTFMLIFFAMILLEQSIWAYSQINVIESWALDWTRSAVSFASCGGIIYTFPMFVYGIIHKDWEKYRRKFAVMACIPIILMALSTIMNIGTVKYLGSGIMFCVIIYTIMIFFRNKERVKNHHMALILRRFSLFTALFSPYMFLDTKVPHIEILKDRFPYGLMSVPIFYFLWNSMSMYYLWDYIRKHGDESKSEEAERYENKESQFYEMYNITRREREVIGHLIKGYSYKRISEELVISLSTVKTHVGNIYRKTEVSNKIELINLIKMDM